MGEAAVSTDRKSIAASTGVGAVHLGVTDGERAVRFYESVVGLERIDEGPTFRLGSAGRELVVLHPDSSHPVVPGRTGLYHLAIVVPSVPEFARVVKRLTEIGYPQAPTDHTLTKADYLWDPDGNGIEIYVETPEDGTWFMTEDNFGARDAAGRLRSGRDPINLRKLFAELDPEEDVFGPLPPGTKMGHVHLHIRDVDEAVRFYSGLVGFDVTGIAHRLGMAFVSAGGYHHHLGLNTWAGPGASPAPPGAAGLREFTIELPTDGDLNDVVQRLDRGGVKLADHHQGGVATVDPSGNHFRLTLRPAGSRS